MGEPFVRGDSLQRANDEAASLAEQLFVVPRWIGFLRFAGAEVVLAHKHVAQHQQLNRTVAHRIVRHVFFQQAILKRTYASRTNWALKVIM